MVHFLGKTKPWNYTYDPKQRRVQGNLQEASSHPGYLLEWWSLYSSCVLPLMQQEHSDQPFVFGTEVSFSTFFLIVDIYLVFIKQVSIVGALKQVCSLESN